VTTLQPKGRIVSVVPRGKKIARYGSAINRSHLHVVRTRSVLVPTSADIIRMALPPETRTASVWRGHFFPPADDAHSNQTQCGSGFCSLVSVTRTFIMSREVFNVSLSTVFLYVVRKQNDLRVGRDANSG
jgi:hypothetical protein